MLSLKGSLKAVTSHSYNRHPILPSSAEFTRELPLVTLVTLQHYHLALLKCEVRDTVVEPHVCCMSKDYRPLLTEITYTADDCVSGADVRKFV